jgi:phage shock protein A
VNDQTTDAARELEQRCDTLADLQQKQAATVGWRNELAEHVAAQVAELVARVDQLELRLATVEQRDPNAEHVEHVRTDRHLNNLGH